MKRRTFLGSMLGLMAPKAVIAACIQVASEIMPQPQPEPKLCLDFRFYSMEEWWPDPPLCTTLRVYEEYMKSLEADQCNVELS